jgi:hypothetical protein
LTILAAVVKDYQRLAVTELIQMIGTLESNFAIIRGSIVWVGAAPIDFDHGFSSVPVWIDGSEGALVGAVEFYSTCDRVERWPAADFPLTNFPGAGINTPENVANWTKFLVRYAVRNWVRWKQVYDIVGLNAMAKSILTLKQLAGVQPPTLPDPDVAEMAIEYTPRKIRDGNYSLRELVLMIHDLGAYAQWGSWENYIFPNGVSPLSLRGLLRVLQTFRDEPYTSFREALKQ